MVKDWATDVMWDNGNIAVGEIGPWGDREITIMEFPALWDSNHYSHKVYRCGSLIIKDTYSHEHVLIGHAVWDPVYQCWHYMS
jgi:hypothetical protein